MNRPHHPIDVEPQSGGFSYAPGDLVTLLRQRAIIIVSVVGVVLALAFAIALSLPSRYEATATVIIDSRERSVVDIRSVLSDLRTDTPTIESEVEIVRSRKVVGRVIHALRLDRDGEFNGRVGQGATWADEATAPKSEALVREIAEAPLTLDKLIENATPGQAIPDDVFEAVLDNLWTYRIRNTHLIGITFRSRSAQKSALIANAIAQAYLADQVEQKANAAEATSVWLERRIEELRGVVLENERRIETFRSQNDLLSSGGQQLDERELTQLTEQVAVARNAAATAKARYENVREMLERPGAHEAVADVLASNTISTLKAELARATRKVAELRIRYGARHPAIQEAVAEEMDARRQLDGEIASIVASLANERDVARAKEVALVASLEALKARAADANQEGVGLRALTREAEASREVYESFLKRYRETAEQRSYQLPDARIVERAATPTHPSSPKRKHIVIGGAVAAIILALIAAAAAELLRPRILTPRIVEGRFGTRHLASLPRLGRAVGDEEQMRRLRLILASPQAPFCEGVRSARLAVDRWRDGNGARVIVCTAPGRDGQRTVLASNLAHQYALSGVRTLLVDGDPGAAGLSRAFAPGHDDGLIDHILDDVALERLVMRERETGLAFLSIGGGERREAWAGDAFTSVRMVEAMATLRSWFDVIVVDAPGLASGAAGQALVAHADQIVVVCDWSLCESARAKRVTRELAVYGDRLAGMVVTEVANGDLGTGRRVEPVPVAGLVTARA